MNCPYCNATVELKDSAIIYSGRSYGNAWICSRYPACDAYVGCHPGTTTALGRLANRELRNAKMMAHSIFDPRWKREPESGMTRRQMRSRAYAWLAKALQIPFVDCHIGMFNVAMCKRVVEVCKADLVRHSTQKRTDDSRERPARFKRFIAEL